MSTVNVGASLPSGANTIGNVKVVDTGGTNQAGVDANNNLKISVNQAANQMGVDSSNNAHMGLWNGANQAAVDSSGNIAVKGNFTEQTGLSAGSLNADLVASTDVSAYAWISLHVTTIATGGTLSFQASNDNFATQIESVNLSRVSSSTTSTSTTTNTGIYEGPTLFRYFRVRQTAYTSGSSTGVLELYTVPRVLNTAPVSASQAGTWTVQPGNTANTTAWKVDGSAVTQPVSGTVSVNALPTGANTIGTVNAAQSGTWTVQPGNTANTTAWLTTPQATTAGGSTVSHTMSAASTNATSLKASAGMVYGYSISNNNASARYVKFYNKASAPTVGTDTPVTTVQVPGNGTVIRAYPIGVVFATGIAWAATGAITDADTTAIGANDLSVDIDYK